MSNTKLKVRHIRVIDDNKRPHNLGGITIAALVDEQYRVKKYAVSVCHERDNFSKKTGFVKASSKLNSDKHSFDGNDVELKHIVEKVCRSVSDTHYNPPRKVIVLDY